LNKRFAQDITELFSGVEEKGKTVIPLELKKILVMDYLEEILVMIFQPSLSPEEDEKEEIEEKERKRREGKNHRLSVCTMETILSYCWDYQYL
jgi:hypothetical protein